jgi:hypothetical protein
VNIWELVEVVAAEHGDAAHRILTNLAVVHGAGGTALLRVRWDQYMLQRAG